MHYYAIPDSIRKEKLGYQGRSSRDYYDNACKRLVYIQEVKSKEEIKKRTRGPSLKNCKQFKATVRVEK